MKKKLHAVCVCIVIRMLFKIGGNWIVFSTEPSGQHRERCIGQHNTIQMNGCEISHIQPAVSFPHIDFKSSEGIDPTDNTLEC